jgi:hypothetical protein
MLCAKSISPEIQVNLNMRASAVLVWLDHSENPTLESFAPTDVQSPPNPNPEAWWRLDEAIKHASEVRREHKKVPWIKTSDAILGPEQISRAYSAMRATKNF